jgi:hypothetical protein
MSEMICTCSVDGLREAIEARLKAMDLLRLRTADDLPSAVIMSLAFDFGADAYIEADQWFGVGISGAGWIGCDEPLDGLIYHWLALAEAQPERVTRGPGTDADIAISRAATEGSLSAIALIEERREAHRATVPEGKRSSHWCATCEVEIAPWTEAQLALRAYWGDAVLEPAVRAAFGEGP